MCFGKNCKSDLKYFKNSCFFGQVRKTLEAPTASHIWLSDHFEYSKFASWHCLKVGMCVISLTPIRWELHYKVWGQLTNSKIQIFQNSHAIIDFFWKFMHFDIFITCFAPKMQYIYHIRLWKSEEKSIIFQDFTVLEKLFDIFRFKNVFIDCELFSHLMFS